MVSPAVRVKLLHFAHDLVVHFVILNVMSDYEV